MSLLNLKNVETFYGSSQALFGIDLNINQGEAVALMGRNGMGKTTTIRSICGMTSAQSGAITFAGKDIRALPSHRIAQYGIGLVPEGRRVFPNLTVEENLIVSARKGEWSLGRVYAFFPRLAERRVQSARSLSGGEQQMLAIGRALMTNPKLLILDEATEGLAPVIRKDIWAAIAKLKASGLSLLIVDKTLSELLPVVDHCILLENGKSVWNGRPIELTEELQGRYLGLD